MIKNHYAISYYNLKYINSYNYNIDIDIDIKH